MKYGAEIRGEIEGEINRKVNEQGKIWGEIGTQNMVVKGGVKIRGTKKGELVAFPLHLGPFWVCSWCSGKTIILVLPVTKLCIIDQFF